MSLYFPLLSRSAPGKPHRGATTHSGGESDHVPLLCQSQPADPLLQVSCFIILTLSLSVSISFHAHTRCYVFSTKLNKVSLQQEANKIITQTTYESKRWVPLRPTKNLQGSLKDSHERPLTLSNKDGPKENTNKTENRGMNGRLVATNCKTLSLSAAIQFIGATATVKKHPQ